MHPAATNTRLIVSNLHWEVTVKDLIVRLSHHTYRLHRLSIILQSIFSTIGTLAREPVIRVRNHTSGTQRVAQVYENPSYRLDL